MHVTQQAMPSIGAVISITYVETKALTNPYSSMHVMLWRHEYLKILLDPQVEPVARKVPVPYAAEQRSRTHSGGRQAIHEQPDALQRRQPISYDGRGISQPWVSHSVLLNLIYN